MDTETTIHPFERSGLGLAPFRYVGMVAQDIEYGRRRLNSRDEAISVTTAPGGTCDHCGTYIVDMFRVRSADGKEFKVGNDCINKVNAVATIAGKARLTADQKALRVRKARLQKEKEAARIEAAREAFPGAVERLQNIPHPSRKGDTMADYVAFLLANAGHSGKFRAARMIEKAISTTG